MKKSVFAVLWLCVVVGLLIPAGNEVFAGTRAKFLLKITDTEGNPLKDVSITLVNKENPKMVYTIKTNKKGKANLIGVDPVLYEITVEKEGYQNRKGEIKLRAGVKVSREWKLLTIPEAKATAVAEKLNSMTQEERDQLAARDEHNEAIKAYEAGDIEKAKEHFKKAIELDDDISHIDYLLLGQFAFNDKSVDEAIKYLERARELDTEGENEADIYRMLGACYMIKEDYPKVREIWGKFVEKNPDPTVLYNLANLEIHDKNFDAATAWLEKCRKAHPEYIDALSLLGDIYIQNKDYKNGVEVYREYLAQLQKQESPDPEKLKNARDTIKLLEEMLQKK